VEIVDEREKQERERERERACWLIKQGSEATKWGNGCVKTREIWKPGLHIHFDKVVSSSKERNGYSGDVAGQFAVYTEHERTRRRHRR
jgi:hypothetical protein